MNDGTGKLSVKGLGVYLTVKGSEIIERLGTLKENHLNQAKSFEALEEKATKAKDYANSNKFRMNVVAHEQKVADIDFIVDHLNPDTEFLTSIGELAEMGILGRRLQTVQPPTGMPLQR